MKNIKGFLKIWGNKVKHIKKLHKNSYNKTFIHQKLSTHMDIRFPISESIDDLLRYGVSGGVFLSYLILSFPEKFNSDCFDWRYFVIFSFIIGFLLFIIARCIVDYFEEKDYYESVVKKTIENIKQNKKEKSQKNTKKKPENKKVSIHLSRALENYYFWRYTERADMSKIYRRASYIYFYLSMAIVFFSGAILLSMSFIAEKCRQIFPFLDIVILTGLCSVLFFILLCKSLKKYMKLCEKQKNFAICLLLPVLLLLIYNTSLYAIHKEILPHGVILVVVSFILSCIFYCKFDSTYEDQKYFVKIAFLNELDDFTGFILYGKKIDSNLIDFIHHIKRINKDNPIKINDDTEKIIPELDDP